jgi:hypothetical protein
MDDRSSKSRVSGWLWVLWAGLPGILMYCMTLAMYVAPWVFDLVSGRVRPISKDPFGELLTWGTAYVLIGWAMWAGFVYLLWRWTRPPLPQS